MRQNSKVELPGGEPWDWVPMIPKHESFPTKKKHGHKKLKENTWQAKISERLCAFCCLKDLFFLLVFWVWQLFWK